MHQFDEIRENYQQIEAALQDSAARAGKNSADIRLLPVSKRQSVEKMLFLQDLLLASGRPVLFGESYVQEYKKKQPELPGDIPVHLIGPLQSNKVKDAVKLFSVIQSVHSSRMATVINTTAEKLNCIQDVYLQVNISDDPNKKGFLSAELLSFIEQELAALKAIRVCGFMTITRYYPNPEDVRPDYAEMFAVYQQAQEKLVQAGFGGHQLELSMGMSSDFDIAIEEGATMVRIGSALLGPRTI